MTSALGTRNSELGTLTRDQLLEIDYYLRRPTTHLELAANIDREWLNVAQSQLYAAGIDRLKATYVFNPRSLARLVAQRSNVDRTAQL